jgi:hypothetical protein
VAQFDFQRSGKQAGVSPSSFYHWQQRLRRTTTVPTPPSPKLVPVNIVPDRTSDSTGSIEIELPNQVRPRITFGPKSSTEKYGATSTNTTFPRKCPHRHAVSCNSV